MNQHSDVNEFCVLGESDSSIFGLNAKHFFTLIFFRNNNLLRNSF